MAPMKSTTTPSTSPHSLLLFTSLLLLTLLPPLLAATVGSGAGAGDLAWLVPATDLLDAATTCKGTIAECLADDDDDTVAGPEDEEFEVGGDSESSRRGLAWRRRYISYGALRRNYIPCSRRGRSYYNCRSRGRANPYRRGCSRITRCRS